MSGSDLYNQFMRVQAPIKDMGEYRRYFMGFNACLGIANSSVDQFVMQPAFFRASKATPLNHLLKNYAPEDRKMIDVELDALLKLIRDKYKEKFEERMAERVNSSGYLRVTWGQIAREMRPDLQKGAAYMAHVCIAVREQNYKIAQRDCRPGI